MSKPKDKPAIPESSPEPEKPSIPIYEDELLKIREIARVFNMLQAVSEDSDTELSYFHWLFKKMGSDVWYLAFEQLAERWEEKHPDVELAI